MNAADQEKLFARVRVKFRGEPSRWHSGYVAGVVDADAERPPNNDQDIADGYADGYEAGYLDASGPDVLSEFPGTFYAPDDLEYRWWAKGNNT